MSKKPEALEDRATEMDGRLRSPSVAKNRSVIADVLLRYLKDGDHVLEIASGSGEHGLHVLQSGANIQWQPSDISKDALTSIEAWRTASGLDNFLHPLELDASREWNLADSRQYNAVVCINMLHISPWTAGLGVMEGAARVLSPGGVLFLYGPFKRNGKHTAPSNEAFDASLRGRDPAWGLRDIESIIEEAAARGLASVDIVPMPSNNFSLIFQRS